MLYKHCYAQINMLFLADLIVVCTSHIVGFRPSCYS